MSFFWIGIALAFSLMVAGASAYFMLTALFRVLAPNPSRSARPND
jgi:hypothetical protein